MIRTAKPEILPPTDPSGDLQGAYEPSKRWRPLLDHLLGEARQRYGLPMGGAYEVSTSDGWFFKKGKEKEAAISNGEAFNLIGLMCASVNEDDIQCGHFPKDKYDEIAYFWKKAALDYNNAVVAGEIRVWARNGGIAGQFRPIASDTWKKSLTAIIEIDGSYSAYDIASWLASCIYQDQLLGVPSPRLCSFFSERIKERREITSEPEMIRIIEEAEMLTRVRRLDVRTLKKLCAEKCLNVSQETFLKLEETLRGPRDRGRRTKQSK